MKDRINTILKHYSLSASQFADAIDVQRSSVSHVLTGRNKPGFDFIQKILEAFLEISAEWLITGKGEMLRKKAEQQELFEDKEPALMKDIEESKPVNKEIIVETVPNFKQKVIEASENRKIERIIIFYKDKTFREYSPDVRD